MASERGQFLIGVCVAFFAAFVLLGMVSFFFTGAADQAKITNKSFNELISHKPEITNWTGVIGAFISENLINNGFGIFSLIIPVFIGIVGLRLMRVACFSLLRSFLLSAFLLIWGSITSAFALTRFFGYSHIHWGGSHGDFIEEILESAVGIFGLVMLIVLLLIVFIVIISQASVAFFRSVFGQPFRLRAQKADVPESVAKKDEIPDEDGMFVIQSSTNESDEPIVEDDDGFVIEVPADEPKNIPAILDKNAEIPINSAQSDEESEDLDGMEEMEDYDPTLDLSHFSFPSADLLKIYDYSGKGIDMDEQRANKDRIITTLKNYGVEIKSIKATVGPTITLYEIVPQDGVRISKIKNLENDIALSLAALGIRIIAPMPGKGTIGIEVPNKDPQIVSMQSIISSRVFQESKYDLPVALGKTITNEVFMFDLCKMPHLLVAGATGQGKSVGLNAIITSLLYKKHPAEMKMVLVDPKMVEFNIYSRIEKHYLAKLPDAEKAIITDVTKVTQTLNSLTKEMDDRYELLMAASVRTIKEYNEKFIKRRLNPMKGHRYLPYIVVIIDEFGDLIMQAGKEIEMPIARIAQKARAVGMHMIIATQRPTTNIITGTIKANFPARMAFRVTSQIDSRTILDQSGANQLIGRGDMLFSSGSDLIRIQCAFVDTPEVEGIAQFIGNQQGYSHAFELPEFSTDGLDDDKAPVDLNDKDSLFEEAARLIVIHQQGSTSLIQRKFSIGYNRAGRLMDQLERAGIVGATQGSKPRDVLLADEYSLEKLLDSLR
ncbi:MAG: DNA translocase FtsK [Prevotella sp.]|nr:DNA translocase FtsK [Prevotella sp.]